jgi:hypothetical protein
MTLAELRTYVRDLTGVYSTDLLPDTLLDRWLAESYSEFNRSEDWPWLAQISTGTLAIGGTTITLATSAGRVLELTVTYPNLVVEQVVSRKGLIQTVDGDDGLFYDINTAGNIVLSKALTETVTYNVNYLKTAPALQTSGKASEIPAEFEGLLAYRTAAKVLRSQADDTNRDQFYLQELASMVQDLRTELITDDDLGPIQIGGEILRVDGRTIGRVNLRYRST